MHSMQVNLCVFCWVYLCGMVDNMHSRRVEFNSFLIINSKQFDRHGKNGFFADNNFLSFVFFFCVSPRVLYSSFSLRLNCVAIDFIPYLLLLFVCILFVDVDDFYFLLRI